MEQAAKEKAEKEKAEHPRLFHRQASAQVNLEACYRSIGQFIYRQRDLGSTAVETWTTYSKAYATNGCAKLARQTKGQHNANAHVAEHIFGKVQKYLPSLEKNQQRLQELFDEVV